MKISEIIKEIEKIKKHKRNGCNRGQKPSVAFLDRKKESKRLACRKRDVN